MRTIDHLVFCVPNLQTAMQQLTDKCGIEVVYGGQHKTKGTENALLNLGNGAYLELLAIDNTNTAIAPPRWMGVDMVDNFTFTRWAIKSTDLANDVAILKRVNPLMGEIFTGSRQKTDGSTLRWSMALPLATPAVEVLPFMVDWKDSVHPTESLEAGCELLRLEITHPKPFPILTALRDLKVEMHVREGATSTLKAVIDTPNGRVVI